MWLFRKLPFFAMMIILAFLYSLCGYLVGYYYGYDEGMKNKIEISR
jgi:hypothetical protein